MNKSVISKIFGFFCLAAIGFTGCNVGLGESVDVIPPSVTIDYPPTAAIIRDSFELNGSWTEDKGILFIKASVRNDDTGEVVESKLVGVGLGSWSTTLNFKGADGKYQFPDGKYTIDVYAMDTSGRTSGTTSRSFEIDNTPPVFVITNPGTKDIENPSIYGSIFKVNGSIAESHTVKEMAVSVYDENNNLKSTWTETNINTAGGTSVTLASYGAMQNAEWKSNYESVYADGSDNKFYCTIKLTDNACVYPGSGSIASGNSTTELWLNDDIYEDILSKNAAHQYEISDLLKVYNGSRAVENYSDLLAKLETTKTDTAANKLAFSLDKDANPSYSFLGYGFTTSAASNKASEGGIITFKAECGKNETTFDPSTIKVYLFEVESNNDNPVTDALLSDIYTKVDQSNYALNNTDKVKCIYPTETNKYSGSSVSSWTESVEVSGIVANNYYLLAATGYDKDKVEFVVNKKNYYGFVGVTTGDAPNATFENPTQESLNDERNNIDFLKNIEAKLWSAECTINKVYYNIAVTDLKNNSKVGNITGEAGINVSDSSINIKSGCGAWSSSKEIKLEIDATKGTWTKDSEYTAATVDQISDLEAANNYFSYLMTITAVDSQGATGSASVTAKVDTRSPEMTLESVSPVADADNKYVNGILTITGKSVKTNIQEVTIKVYPTSDSSNFVSVNPAASSYVTAKVDASKFYTGNINDIVPVTIEIKTKDSAGNEVTTYNTDYSVSEKTNIPTVVLSGVTQTETNFANINTETNLYGMGNNTIYGTVKDDDGLSEIKIYVDSVTEENCKKTIDSAKLKGTTVYALNEDMSGWKINGQAISGDHKLFIVATDTTKKIVDGSEVSAPVSTGTSNTDTNVYGMAFAYDNDLPTISVSTVGGKAYSSGMWLGKDFEVIGSASDSSGVATVTLKSTTAGTAPGSVITDTAVSPALKLSSWKDAVTNHVDGNAVNRVYIAKDKYGRSNEVSILFSIDKTSPVFNPSYIKIQGTRAGSTAAISLTEAQAAGTWFTNGNIKIDGQADASGAALVEANPDSINVDVNNSTINPEAVSGTAGFNKFSTTIPLSDGTTTVKLSTSDKAGNGPVEQTITLKVDTVAPVITGDIVLSTTSGASFTSGETLLENSLTVKVKATDATSGVKSAAVLGKSTDVTAADSEGYYVISLDKTALADGTNDLTVVVTDNAGNTNTEKRFTVVVDNKKPVIGSSITVLPTVSDNSNTYVNGVITVSGRVTDETKLKSTNGLEWWVTNTSLAASNTSSGTAVAIGDSSNTKKYSLSDGAQSDYSIKIDTATLKDGVYTVHLKATDFAGNVSDVAAVNFTSKQSTNIPTVVLSGVTQTETTAANVTVGTNLFGMGNNTLYGTIKDDDGLSEIKIYIDSVIEDNRKKTIDSSTLNGTTVYSLNEDISTWGAGAHQLYIVVEDTSTKLDADGVTEVASHVTTGTENSATNVYGMAFAYDNDLPTISISYVNGKTYSSGMWLPKEFAVKGTVLDSSGIASVKVSGSSTNLWSSGTDWTESLTDQAEAVNVTRKYIVTDKYGRTGEVSIIYNIDVTAPAFDSSKVSVRGTTGGATTSVAYSALASTWFSNKTIQISGAEAALTEVNLDSLSVNVDSIDYPINADVNNGNKFTTTVTFAGDGKAQTATFTAKDKANNSSAADALQLKLNVDTTAPVLDSVTTNIAADELTNVISLTGSTVGTLEATVKTTDATSGISSVAVYEGSTKLVESTTVTAAGTQGTYVLTVPDSLTTGSHTLTIYVTDAAGNVNNSRTLAVSVDKTAPVFDGAISVTPTVTENSTKYVNGVISVSGKLTDETALLATGGLEWWVTQDSAAASNTSSGSATAIASSTSTNKVNLTAGRSSDFTFKIDTTALADGTYKIHLKANDAANNSVTLETTEFTSNQSTDIPTVVLSGVTQTETVAANVTVGTNLFGMGNNTLYGTIKDDDGISSIKIYVDKLPTADPAPFADITIDSSILKGATVYSLNENVSGWGAGNHTLYIVVEDTSTDISGTARPVKTGTTNSESNVYGMAFAYDDDLPTISISTINGNSYSSGMWLPAAFNVVGSTNDSSGIASITLNSEKTTASTPAAVISDTDGITSGTAGYLSNWKDAVSAHSNKNDVKRVYKVTDKYGRTNEATITYSVDTVAPVLNTGFMQVEGQRKLAATASQTISGTAETGTGPFTGAVKTTSDMWFTNGSIKISGVAGKDSQNKDTSAFVEVNPDTISVVVGSNTYTINPTAGTNGLNTFSTTLSFGEGISSTAITANDKAGNTPATANISIKVDSIAPVVTATLLENDTVINKDSITVTPNTTDAVSGVSKIEIAYSDNFESGKIIKTVSGIGQHTVTAEESADGSSIYHGLTVGSVVQNAVNSYTTAIVCPIDTKTSGVYNIPDGRYSIYVRAYDVAGNVSSIVNAGTVVIDRTAPTIQFVTPITDSGIYGTTVLSGTYTENNIDTSVNPVLYVYDTTESKWKIANTFKAGCVTASEIYSDGKWTVSIDTTIIAPAAQTSSVSPIYVAVVLQDLAENTNIPTTAPIMAGESKSYHLNINQDLDRPTVEFYELTGATGSIRMYAKTITGMVTDSDGLLKKDGSGNYICDLKISSTAITTSSGWSSFTQPANTLTFNRNTGVFTYTPVNEEDGEKEIYIYFKDSNGTEFWAGKVVQINSVNTTLGQPFVKYYGANTNADLSTKITYKIDKTAPAINFVILGTGSTAEEAYADAARQYDATIYAAADTEKTGKDATNPNEMANSVLAGGSLKKFVVFALSAWDSSGIDLTTNKPVVTNPKAELTGQPANLEFASATKTYKTYANAEDTTGTSHNVTALYTTAIDVSGLSVSNVATKPLSIQVHDQSGMDREVRKTLLITNIGPVVEVTTPEPASAGAAYSNSSVSAGVSVNFQGATTASGSGTVSRILYKVVDNSTYTYFNVTTAGSNGTALLDKRASSPNQSAAPTEANRIAYMKSLMNAATNPLSEENCRNSFSNASMWQFKLDGSLNPMLPNASDESGFENYSRLVHSDSGLYELPVWFYSVDELGNESCYEYVLKRYNPYGDRPTATILYPELAKNTDGTKLTYATLSGTIRVNGAASDNVSVSSVYIQVDADGDGDFDVDDINILKTHYEIYALNGNSYGISEENGVLLPASGNYQADSVFWGIKAQDAASWFVTLNADRELNNDSSKVLKTGSETQVDYYKVHIRVAALDGNNLLGNWSEKLEIRINPNAPTIGTNIKPYILSGSAIRDQKNDMWLKGDGTLCVSVQHNAKINEITYSIAATQSALSGVTENKLVETNSSGTTSIVDSAKIKAVDGSAWDSETHYTANTSDAGYLIKIPLGTGGANNAGSKAVKITATSSDGITSSEMFTFNYDNKAPSIENMKSNGTVWAVNGNKALVNSNSRLSVGGDIKDDNSGFNFAMYYFFRDDRTTVGKNRRVYDPTLKTAAKKIQITGTDNTTKVSGIVEQTVGGQPVYGFNATVTRSSDTTLTLSTASDYVTNGCIVYINDTWLILSGSTDGLTFTLSESVPASVTTAFFPYAKATDSNTGVNGAESANNWNDSNESITNDDGDKLIESVSKAGTIWSWDASFHGDYIPDGKVTMVIFAFDKSGNASATTRTGKVQNNAPRLAKLHLGTDLSGDSEYSDNEFETYNILGKESIEQTDYDLTTLNYGSTTRKSFTIKDKLAVVPEFTGGNGSGDDMFKMVFNTGDVTEYSTSYTRSVVAPATATNTNAMISNTKSKFKTTGTTVLPKSILFELTNTQVTGKTSPSASDDGNGKKISFTFWDSTDECIQGTDSQSCYVRVTDFVVAVTDSANPTTVVNPFYWNGLTDNSIYGSSSSTKKVSQLNGHIELESDWTKTNAAGEYLAPGYKNYKANTTGFTTGEFDEDPKVSGKIVFTGTAYDNVALSEISFSYGKLSGIKATYNSSTGSWTCPDTTISDGYIITVSDAAGELGNYKDSAYFNQNGHKVYWTFAVDTEAEVTNLAQKDASLTVVAKDRNENLTATTNDKIIAATTPEGKYTVTDGTTNYPVYKTDVVPYITSITTRLSAFNSSTPSVYARSAQGVYTVAESEVIKIEGFNIGSNAASVTVPGMSAKTLVNGTVTGTDDATTNTITITAASGSGESQSTGGKSGDLIVKVNGIQALNNYNYDDARGMAVEDTSEYEGYYNRQPNGINNNQLTDRLAIDVWQFKDAAKPVNGGAELVTMKINPKTGVPGFSYANSVLYFNMPAYNSDSNNENAWGAENKTLSGSQYSQIPVGMNYGGFSHNSFCFDSYGYSYGAAMCTDTQNATASAFFQFFSRETPISYNEYDQNMNYANCANASRIDSSTMNLGSSSDTNWQTNINRIQSISMDTSYSGGSNAPSTGTPVYVYMSYFDDITKQVRFRWGTVGDASDNIDGKDNSTDSNSFSTRKSNAYGLNDVWDGNVRGVYDNTYKYNSNSYYYTGYAQGSKNAGGCRPSSCEDSYIKYSYNANSGIPIQVVAQGDITVGGNIRGAYKQSTTYKAGKYVSMCIVGKTTSSPKAVVFWSNGLKLYMAYNENPLTSNSWTSRLVDSNGGLNVKCAVDSDNGIHVAYYTTGGGNLKYAYLQNYKATPSICTVDANGAVGTKCTIDVVKNNNGKQVPYISYQLIGGVATYNAKVAYRTDFSSASFEGSDSKDFFTGKWEISIVPTESLLKDDSINIGLWRGSDGKAKNFTSNNNWKSADVLRYNGSAGSSSFETVSNNIMNVGSPSIVYGNNTSNPIIAYGVESGAIEMAQKK